MKMYKVELLMSLENHRGRMDRARTIDMLKQAEDAIRAAEQMKDALREMQMLVNDFSKNLRVCVLQDYARLNNAPIAARKAVLKYLQAIPEREDEQEATPA